MRIAHLSDFHFTKLTLNPLRLFPKRIFGHLNWLIRRRKDFNYQQLDALPELFRALKIDLILFGGDFTSSSLPGEFKIAKKWISKMPAPWIAIPGNHDRYTRASANRFYQYFDELEPHPIGNNWWVVPLDTACPNPIRSSKGVFTNSTKLEQQLEHIPGNVILLNHYPFFQQEGPDRCLQGGEKLEQLIRKYPKIKLYLHGHTHRHSIADLRVDHLPIILDSGSCCLKTGSWNLIDLTTTGCSVTPYMWQNILQGDDLVLAAPLYNWIAKERRDFLW